MTMSAHGAYTCSLRGKQTKLPTVGAKGGAADGAPDAEKLGRRHAKRKAKRGVSCMILVKLE